MGTNSLEDYILKQIPEIEMKLQVLESKRDDYSDSEYWALFYRYTGQKSILYQCLTAHDNKYSSPAPLNNKK